MTRHVVDAFNMAERMGNQEVLKALTFVPQCLCVTLENQYSYKHVGGLGNPAILQAYFKGPCGNSLCK
jgi:hypothetical protein